MTNLQLHFTYPWLLLLLIPAFALTAFLYFRRPKKYRRTRNRIISNILHTIVMVLCILALAGLSFSYDLPNTDNEILLLVDVSDSGEEAVENRNAFVKQVIDESNKEFKIGVVTFGYTQVYAAELSSRTDDTYEKYLAAERPDTSATDIASALSYAQSLFSHPKSAKIVLISDGAETDGQAINAIGAISRTGTRVDTVHILSAHENEVEIVGVETPDYNISVGDPFVLKLNVNSDHEGQSSVVLHDKAADGTVKDVTESSCALTKGLQTLEIGHVIDTPGMHELEFEITDDFDTLGENNSYFTYLYLEVYNRVLIVERNEGDAEMLNTLLTERYEGNDQAEVKVVNISNAADELPQNIESLCEYDQVILVNIANADIEPLGFDGLLYEYVYERGGGLFTVGGNEVDGNGSVLPDPYDPNLPLAHTYDREDMRGTLYQQMLPVQAVDYTPPIGVMFVIDRSGSMGTTDTSSGMGKLELAKTGAIQCLEGALSADRDWAGVITLEDDYSEEAELTKLTYRQQLINQINEIETGGGTVFTGALDRAGAALRALSMVERKHIILITDGQPSDQLYTNREEKTGGYGEVIKRYHDMDGITCSVVAIGGNAGTISDMQELADIGGGVFYPAWDTQSLPQQMLRDLNRNEIKGVVYEPFTPRINEYTNVTAGITQEQIPQLDGYYGTKLKAGASAPLMGEYVPIYAQWKFGEGRVGSFMCDLNGYWSAKFIEDGSLGRDIIFNIITGLYPTESIRYTPLDIELYEDNYQNELGIYPLGSQVQEGDTITVTITSPPEEEGGEAHVETIVRGSTDDGSVSFVIRRPGIHTVAV